MILPLSFSNVPLLAAAPFQSTALGQLRGLLQHGSQTRDLQDAYQVMGELADVFTATGHPRFSGEALAVQMDINRSFNSISDKGAALKAANDYCLKLLKDRYRTDLKDVAQHEEGQRLLTSRS